MFRLFKKKYVYPELKWPSYAREMTEYEKRFVVNGGAPAMTPEDQYNIAEAYKNGDQEKVDEIMSHYQNSGSGTTTTTPPSTTGTTPTTTTPPASVPTTPPANTTPSSSSSNNNGSGGASGGGSGSGSGGNSSPSSQSPTTTSQHKPSVSEQEGYLKAGLSHVEDYKKAARKTLGIKGSSVTGSSFKSKEVKGWRNNGDGTHTVTAEGATLWDRYGPNWRELSHYEGDPTKLHVGDTVGKKIKVDPGAGEMTVTEMIEREKKKGTTSSPVKAPEPPLEQKTLRKEEVFSFCLNTFYEANKIKTPGARFCDKLLSSQNSLHSSGGSLFGSLEKGIGDAGNASYILSKTTSDVSGLEGISNTMGKTSGYLGLSSAIIDFCQVLEEPSVANSRDLIVTTWGLVDPVGSLFLQSYYNCFDTVNDYFGNVNPGPYSLISLDPRIK